MAKLSLYLDCRFVKSGPAPLKVRICEKRVVKFVSTEIRIDPKDWDIETSSVTARDLATMSVASDVLKLKSIVEEMALCASPTPPDGIDSLTHLKNLIEERVKAFSNRFSIESTAGTPKPDRLFMNMLRKVRDSKERAGTWEVYDRTVRAILVFDPDADRKTFSEIDYTWLKSFEAHCKAKGMKVNSISILMRNIRAAFNEAIREDLTEEYPFKKYTIKQEETEKRSLTLEELRRLASMEVESCHEEYRDMFFLSFLLIGINMTDLLSLRPSDLKGDRIEYARAKTSTKYSIKVYPEAMSLINKYRGEKYLLAPLERYSKPKDYIQHMDRALKQIGRETGKRGKVLSQGIYPQLSSYWARHSWATLAYEQGVSIDIIGQALGHKNREHRITMVYIRPNSAKVDQANRLVIDALMGLTPSTSAA